jgi:hypothetical protein
LIKARDDLQDEKSDDSEVSIDVVQGMSCRLLPFNSLRGQVYSVIIESARPVAEQELIFRKILSILGGGGDLERLRPLQKQNVRRQWIPDTWRLEARFFRTSGGFLKMIQHYFRTIIAHVMTKFVFAFDRHNSMTGQPSEYESEMLLQSDWLKFNGAMYLVLDLTASEFEGLETALNQMEAAGDLVFGAHRSSSALVVCHLNSQSQKKHFHFVDGSDGGLTTAATRLKEKASKQNLKENLISGRVH